MLKEGIDPVSLLGEMQMRHEDSDINLGTAHEGEFGIDDAWARGCFEDAARIEVAMEKAWAIGEVDGVSEIGDRLAIGLILHQGFRDGSQSWLHRVEIQTVVGLQGEREDVRVIQFTHGSIGEGGLGR